MSTETVVAFKTLIEGKNGIYTEHIEASTEEKLHEIFNKYYANSKLVSFKQKEMVSKKMKLLNMIDGQEYEATSHSDHSNDIVIFRKEGDWIYSTIRGGEFITDVKHRYKLVEIVNLLDDVDAIPFEDMDIDYLIYVDSQVYADVLMPKETAEKFKGLAEDLTEE
ncbi:hypothetical protein [Bacillus toyonensis]|uniref:hypothetical protein n=1 Tax=Bacillus toyonensis TaxID=155322 RepID=UPI000BF42740|nr:hypothetical protein [Bacillus toyonensis]PGF05087.1 hypothetical protein COM61_01255 [Bacillus toyonensis]